LEETKLELIDVTEDSVENRVLDLNNKDVTNRWSRYIGALGIESVQK
jgi:hypothetical protein